MINTVPRNLLIPSPSLTFSILLLLFPYSASFLNKHVTSLNLQFHSLQKTAPVRSRLWYCFLCSYAFSLSLVTDSGHHPTDSLSLPFRLDLAYTRPDFPHMVCSVCHLLLASFFLGLLFNSKDGDDTFL